MKKSFENPLKMRYTMGSVYKICKNRIVAKDGI